MPCPVPQPGCHDDLFALVAEIMNVECGCHKPNGRNCPKNWHTWRRASSKSDARVFVRKPGRGDMVHFNLSKQIADGSAFASAVQSANISNLVKDDRYKDFTRFGFKPNLNNPAHVTFLEYWLPRTIN